MKPPDDNPDTVTSEILYGPNGEFLNPETPPEKIPQSKTTIQAAFIYLGFSI
jgi:hypothetical protein